MTNRLFTATTSTLFKTLAPVASQVRPLDPRSALEASSNKTVSVGLRCCVTLVALAMLACGPRAQDTAAGTAVGAGLGAGAGAAIGAIAGNTGAGAAVGATTGAAIGAIAGSAADDSDAKIKEYNEFIERQNKEKEKQDQELQDLKRQQFHDGYYQQRYQGRPR
jgi:hypothetical protein